MKIKNIVFSAIAITGAGVISPAYAADEWSDIYGKIMVTIDRFDNAGEDAQWEVNSYASRFGIKGKGEAGSLEAFYQLEWEVDLADNSKGSTDNIKSRNQIVGVRGGFGEVFVGRHDTPTKKLQKKIDIFGDLTGDIKYTFNGEKRADNIFQYGTPKLGGFKAKIAFVPGEGENSNDGLADATSVSIEYKIGNLNIGLSQDSDIEGEGVDTLRFMTQYKLEHWQFGLMFQDTDNSDANLDGTGIMASVKYTFGYNTIKLQVIDSDSWEAGVSGKVKYSSQISVGWDYKLGKKTTFMSYFTEGEQGASEETDRVFGIGLVQKF